MVPEKRSIKTIGLKDTFYVVKTPAQAGKGNGQFAALMHGLAGYTKPQLHEVVPRSGRHGQKAARLAHGAGRCPDPRCCVELPSCQHGPEEKARP